MKAFICDKCGELMKSNLNTVTAITLSTQKGGAYQTYHFCDDCVERFGLFIEAGEDEDE